MTSYNSNYVVYMHRNNVNYKTYIGITCQKPKYRWGKNGINYKLQPKFYNAILKYGWDNFEHIILASELTIQQALNLEEYYIIIYNSIDNGYNISTGGGVGFSKSVRCITTNQYFDSVADAAQYANVASSTLSHCLHGDWQTSGTKDDIRLEWCFTLDEYNTDAQAKYNQRQSKNTILQHVNQNDTDIFIQEYCNNNMTITNIAKKYGTSKERVSALLKHADVEVLPSAIKARKSVSMYDKNWNFIRSFDTIREALEFVGRPTDNSRLKKACEENWRIYKGYHWKYNM